MIDSPVQNPSTEGVTVFDEESPSIARTAPPASHKKLWKAAYIFIPINFVIFAAFIYFMSLPAAHQGPARTLDNAAPFETAPAPAKASGPKVAPNVVQKPLVAPEDPEMKRALDRARLKLSNAERWKETHPEKAKKLAQEAIDSAPESTIADQARELIRTLR